MDKVEIADAPQAQESEYSEMFDTYFELTDSPPDERDTSKRTSAMIEAQDALDRAMDEDDEKAELAARRKMREIALDKERYGEVETVIETPEGFKIPVEITYRFEQGDPAEENPIHKITIVGILVLEQCGNIPAGHRITDLSGPVYMGRDLDEYYEQMLEPEFPKNCGKESIGEWMMTAISKVVEDKEGLMMQKVKERMEDELDEMQDEFHGGIAHVTSPKPPKELN